MSDTDSMVPPTGDDMVDDLKRMLDFAGDRAARLAIRYERPSLGLSVEVSVELAAPHFGR